MSTPFDVRRWASQAGIETTGGFAVVAECVTMDELERFAHIAISSAAKSWQQTDRIASELQDTCHKQAQRIAALEQAARQALAAMEASGPQWHALERRAIAALREAIGAGGVEPLRRRLAASLTCWHRLTGQEAAELVALFQGHPAQAAPADVAEQGPVAHDEELLEQMYWEFDGQRRRTGEERLAFKGKMRSYASEFRRRSDGKMTFAQSVSDDMMNLADRLGSEYDDVDPRAWKHLLVYAPKAALAATQPAQPGWCDGCSPDNCCGCGPGAVQAGEQS